MTSKYIDNANYATSGYTPTGAYQSITIGVAGSIGGSGLIGGVHQAYSIVNDGGISGLKAGIYLQDGGGVTNEETGAIEGYNGVSVDNNSAIDNAGSILATGRSGSGVRVKYGTGTLTNSGAIEATGSLSVGVDFYVGGNVTNGTAGAQILGVTAGIVFSEGTLVNFGTIAGTGSDGIGVSITAISFVENNIGGLIEGATGILVAGLGTIANDGPLEPSTIVNDGTVAATGTGGVAVSLEIGSVTNLQNGLIDASGMGGIGVEISGAGSVVNAGLIDALSGGMAVYLHGGADLSNDGTIEGGTSGVVIAEGGSISNAAGGLIDGYSPGDGVGVSGSSSYLFNAGTIEGASGAIDLDADDATILNSGSIGTTGSNGFGIRIGGGLVENDSNQATIIGGVAISAGTISNAGTIIAPGSTGIGIELQTGLVANLGSASLIQGYSIGVEGGASAAIMNAGTIIGTGTAGIAIVFGGGTIINAGGALIEATGPEGRAISGGSPGYPGNITNDHGGTIEAIGTAGVGIYSGFAPDSTIVNSAGGLIQGASGIEFKGGVLKNFGIVLGNSTSYSSCGAQASTIINYAGGLIAGAVGARGYDGGFDGPVYNYGTILGTLSGAEGKIKNAQGALIEGFSGVTGGGVNLGTIDATGSTGVGVTMQYYGTISNIGASALIIGATGITGDGTVINGGTIEAGYRGVYLTIETNDFHTEPGGGEVENTGTIFANMTSGVGIYVSTGLIEDTQGNSFIGGDTAVLSRYSASLVNAGTIEGASQGVKFGAIYFAPDGSTVPQSRVDNSGVIEATGSTGVGLTLYPDSQVTNAAGAMIAGYVGIDIKTGTYRYHQTVFGAFINAGTITGVGTGVVASPTTMTNEAGALITGSAHGVAWSGGTLDNSGTIESSGSAGSGVLATGGGVVDNAPGGVIEGSIGILFGNSGIVYNDGTIASTLGASATAVQFAGAGDLLVIGAGSALVGGVGGYGRVDVLAGASFSDDGFTLAGLIDDGVVALEGTSTVMGALGFYDGTLSGTGVLAAAGAVSLNRLVVDGGGILRDHGTITAAGRLRLGDGSGSGHLSVKAGAIFDIETDVGIGTRGVGSVGNHGLFEKTLGTGASVIGVAVVNDGTIRVSSGTLLFDADVSGSGIDKIKATGTLEFGGAVAASETIRFTPDSSGELILDDPSGSGLGFAGAVSGFRATDRIELASFFGTPTLSWTQSSASGGTLIVTDGPDLARLALFGQYSQAGFKAKVGSVGTVITYAAPQQQIAGLASAHG